MEKNRNTILTLYAVLSLVVVLCSLPDFEMQNIGYSLVFIELIVAYVLRFTLPRGDSFENNHTTFVIRTIWIYSLIFALGMIGAAIIIGQQGNPAALQPMIDALSAGLEPTPEQTRPWLAQYYADNEALILNSARLWLCPAQLYLVWRILRGGGRAFKNYRVANPKSWL